MSRKYSWRSTNALRPRDLEWVKALRTSIGTSVLQLGDVDNRYYLTYILVNNGDGNAHTICCPTADGPFHAKLVEAGGTFLMNLSGAEYGTPINTELVLGVADAWASGGDAGVVYVTYGFMRRSG